MIPRAQVEAVLIERVLPRRDDHPFGYFEGLRHDFLVSRVPEADPVAAVGLDLQQPYRDQLGLKPSAE